MADTGKPETNLPPDPDGPGGDLDHPEVEDTAGLGGWVWIVLFGSVMTMSLLANVLMTFCVIFNRKKHSVVYFIHILMFFINLVDYSLLIFEFSLGMGHEYPYSSSSCTLYQISVRGNPILQAATVIVLVHFAAGLYCNNNESRPSGNSSSNNNGNSEVTVTCSRTNSVVVFFCVVVGLVVTEGLFSLPTAAFASIVTVNEKRYCEIDLATVTPEGGLQQQAISIFYLLYSAIFSYWLPLLLSIIPMTRLYRSANNDKYPEVSVVLATASSFFVFFLLHGSVVFSRHLIDAAGIQISTYHSWMIKVAQSLLWLVAYFWHFTRPALAILLDPDIKSDVASLFRVSNGDYTHVEMRGRQQQHHQQQQHQNTVTILLPLSSSATLTPSTTTKESVGVDKNDSSVVALLQNSDETDLC